MGAKGTLVVAVMLLSAAALAAVTVSVANTTTTTSATPSAAPVFKGLTLLEATNLARERGVRVIVVLRAPSNSLAGTVLGQDPNRQWPAGLVVSSGRWANFLAELPGEQKTPVRKECAVAPVLTEDGNVAPVL